VRILIHCPSSGGGIAEYVNCQARSFTRQHHDVLLLCPKDYLQGRILEYPALRIYGSLTRQSKSPNSFARLLGLTGRLFVYLFAYWQLLVMIIRHKPDFVLFDSYIEYLSPLWIWPHVILSRIFGIVYVANLHDPVRDFVVGPRWWHKLSVNLGYWPINICVVHQRLADQTIVPSHVRVIVAPHGLYEIQASSTLSSDNVRRDWGFPSDAVVCLSFGFIRDNKNLDLLIRALPNVPHVHLAVIGSAQSSLNKPLSFYQDLAQAVGVSARVIFSEEFVPDEDIPSYFAASDFVALTYNKTFHSQSGVLNLAVRARRPVLASAGESPLRSAVIRYRLGEFVKPDDQHALERGMLALARQSTTGSSDDPDWEGYESYASWDTNTAIIVSEVIAHSSGGKLKSAAGGDLHEAANRPARR
jgi:glycosyltransferase involved in cell wall biosynthesis